MKNTKIKKFKLKGDKYNEKQFKKRSNRET